MAYIGEIIMFAGDYAPEGWMLCNGALLKVRDHQPLFSIIENKYGGDRKRGDFALPDLRGRGPVGCGKSGAAIASVGEAETGGQDSQSITLGAQHLPRHTHALNVYPDAADTAAPGGTTLLGGCAFDPVGGSFSIYRSSQSTSGVPVPDPVKLHEKAIEATGTTQEATLRFSVRNPYLGVNFIICADGEFPTRP